VLTAGNLKQLERASQDDDSELEKERERLQAGDAAKKIRPRQPKGV